MLKLTAPVIRLAALAAVVGSFAYVAPVSAAPMDSSDAPAATDQDNAAPAAAPSTKAEARDARVEARIKTLHDKLKITPDQEDAWGNVAQTMRDNEATVAQLVQARHQNPDSMTAVQDLQSYQQITQAHADGLQKLTASFDDLYNAMSDDQKKNADEVFGRFEGHRGGAKHSAKHHK